ncbi:hypothetical protein MMC32_003016 [Xylographa parallela]|nr:hypothetical protein [Xylographa parallela]
MQLTNPLLLALLSLTTLSTAQYYNRLSARDLSARDAYAYAYADADAFYSDDTNEALYARDAQLSARDAQDLDALLYARDLYARAAARGSGQVVSGGSGSSSSSGDGGAKKGTTVGEAELLQKMAADKPKKCAKHCGPMRAHSQAAYDQCYASCMAL